jgi:hypothetical protein
MDEFRILIFDDDKNRHKKFTSNILDLKEKINKPILDEHVYNAQDCIDILKKKTFSHLFFDHDLDEKIHVSPLEKNTGSEVARWLKANPDNPNNGSKIYIHSLNEEGVAYMKALLPHAIEAPFAWEEFFFESISW